MSVMTKNSCNYSNASALICNNWQTYRNMNLKVQDVMRV